MALGLIIFDCDGVLVDSEPLSNSVFVELLSEIGLPMTLKECTNLFVGRSTQTNLKTIEHKLGRPLPAEFLSKLQTKASEAFDKYLRPIPGIETALAAISTPVCVASGSEPEVIRKNLALTGLLTRFEGKIFSAAHVSQGKPAPDLFLHAAQAMKVKPCDCVVIEDSVPGVKAGQAAEMTVLGYVGTFASQVLVEAGAHFVFDDMSKLPEILALHFEQYAQHVEV